ncbi:MAG: DNA internalization-related competence protein ComEC/Rec2 [Deltaproteobacteria bacterium]|nr:DNA internalization-related competence protein ComEC/Rec2 [Deltaproteobacteria bacterium]
MRRPVIPLLTALILGITVGSLVNIPDIPALAALLATIAALLFPVVAGRKGSIAFCLLISLFLLGILNINLYLHPYCGRDDITLHAGKDKLTVEGLVCNPPRVLRNKTSLVVNSTRIIRDENVIPVHGKIFLSVKDNNRLFKYGNYIRAKVKFKEPHNFNNPGGFDYKRYLLYRGIRLRGYISSPSDIVIMRESAGDYFRTRIERYRSHLRELILENAPFPEGSILRALVLGEKEGIPEDIIEGFNRAGVSHILAISGLHVGIIAFISLIIIRTIMKSSEYLLLRFNIFKVSALFAVIPIISYAFIAGLRISTIRATIMILCFLIALLAGRGRDLLNILAFAAFAILIISPASLFDISFQLSFMAVASIILITPTLGSMIPRRTGDGILRKGIISIILFMMVSLSAMIGTYPLIALYFNRVSSIALLSNLFIIPIIGFIVLPLGILFIITAPFAPIATALIQIASFFIRISVSIIDFLSSFSFSNFHVTTPTVPEIILYYLLIITALKLLDVWRSKEGGTDHTPGAVTESCFFPVAATHLGKLYRANRSRVLALFLGSILLFFTVDAFYTNIKAARQKYLEVTFIDVGQGSSTLIKFPGGVTMLVDGGGFYDRSFDLGKYVVAPYLWHEKIKKVDVMVLTHPDQDHIGGLPYIADNFKVGEVWSNGCESKNESCRKLKKIIMGKAIHHRIVDKDTEEQTIGGASIRILNPAKSVSGRGLHFPDSDYNNNGVVMKITFGNMSILLPADISESAEAELIASGSDLKADILMAPHHGARSSSSTPFLKAVRPEIVIVSCGPGNVFGFPHSDVLDRYRKAGTRVLRIDKCGAVTIQTDGEKIETENYKSTESSIRKWDS